MKAYDLYGVEAGDLEGARSLIESRLGISLLGHESGYRGGAYYRLGKAGAEHYILQRNFDEVEGEWANPKHQDAPFLFYVNETTRSADIRTRLTAGGNVTLLSHDEMKQPHPKTPQDPSDSR
jgi:hypothetical protein